MSVPIKSYNMAQEGDRVGFKNLCVTVFIREFQGSPFV